MLNSLQISDNDLIGRRFNGHDLHIYLRERNIDSKQLVWNKKSSDPNTYVIAGNDLERGNIFKNTLTLQNKHCLNNILNPFSYDILYNKLFLESDVVHFHLVHNYLLDLQLLPMMSRLKPIVWTLHDPWALSGHCVHHGNCDKWKNHCNNCPAINAHFPLKKDNSALNFALKKQAVKNSQIDVIVASKWMYEKTKQSPIFENKKIHLIPFGVNQNIFKPLDKIECRKKLHIPEDATVLVFRSDYSGFKGMDYIEYVLQNIKSKTPIYALATATDFKKSFDNITVINYGWVHDDLLMSTIYSASDLLLAPSQADAFGMMAVEAMCCGTLPIVLEGTALPETINAPLCGISTPQNLQKYIESVQYYINHPKARNTNALKCYEYATKKYNLNTYIDKINKVYHQAIDIHANAKEDTIVLNQIKKYLAIEPSLHLAKVRQFSWKDILFKKLLSF